jgi:replicative DNA helicase
MTATAEASIASMIGTSYSGDPADTVVKEEEERVSGFSFDHSFQLKVAAFACRDDGFMRRCSHLLKPEYFENAGVAALVSLSLEHFKRYRCVPDKSSTMLAIVDAVKAKVIRKDILETLKAARLEILEHALTNIGYVEDKVAEFARYQAVSQAILQSVDLLEQKKMPKILEIVKTAINIGANEEGDAYYYFERIDTRTEARLDVVMGKNPPKGITTGVLKMDEKLYHNGWGRKELVSIMGAAKSGKSTALINFAKSAALAKHNVLYVTLEVSAAIASDRLDASVSSTLMKELTTNVNHVREIVEDLQKRSGQLIIHEFASGTMTPNMLVNLIERYKSPGRKPDGTVRNPIKFDLIVVDYADIMAPNFRTNDPIENSKSVYIDLRAIAFQENVAVLTATQTNREGAKKAVATMTDVSEDFNKVRTVDLMISINKTDEEAKRGEARLYFAASRNQEGGFTIVVKQNIAMMQFITSVLRVE